MFSKEIYVKRRAELKKKVGSGLLLLLGNDEMGANFAHNTFHYRQDSTFLYYFGIDQAGLTAVIDIDNDEEILFGNELTIDDIVWTGPLAPLSEIAASVGITRVLPTAQIASFCSKATTSGQAVHHLPAYRAEHILKLQEWLQIAPAQVATSASPTFIKAVVAMRSYKQAEEIAELQQAVDVSTELHELFMRRLKPGVTELEIAGELEGYALQNANGLSYPAILTVKGETLHIHASHRKMQAGQLALCDAGAESIGHYAGDLTRTAPVSGKFSAIQKDLYNLVLKAEMDCIAACKPGILFKDIHAMAGEILLDGLKGVGIIKGDIKEAVANDVHTLFFQCGLGHMMGLDVHDMENLGEQYVGYNENLRKGTAFGWKSLRLGKALEPGFVITVEPGLYFIPTLMDMWKAENKLADFINYSELEKFRDFSGIRIEDDLLITENGSMILGNKIAPKTVEEIENFMAQ